ncbi:hypothetical protein C0995_004285 [Termitomyces sp. Mi166|nr:hypothetical protein C0995_004285 [Termitomyces sp. Mi166\
MNSKELEDEKIVTIADTYPLETDVSYYSNEGYSRAYGLKCDLNIWIQGVAIVLGQVQQELHPSRVEFATLALCAGLIVGAMVWGVIADLLGRRLSFNVRAITLFLAGLFGTAAGGAPNFVTFASLIACLGVGLGGNGSMTLLMFIMRFVVFDLQESPKYLVAKGRDQEAIAVLEHIAKRNGKTISLTLEQLLAIDGAVESHVKPLFSGRRLAINSTLIILCWGLIGLAYPLFNSFLPLYLQQHVTSSAGSGSIDTTFRNYAIISIMGIPGSIIACLTVDWMRGSKSRWFLGGRKLTLMVSTGLTGLFLFLFTTSKTNKAVLGWSCASGTTQMAMYGVLFAYTPEVFPAPHRGTGDALASTFNRIMGILSPVIKIATTTAAGTAAPGSSPNGLIFVVIQSFSSILVAASLFMVAAVLMVFLPIETAGRAAM